MGEGSGSVAVSTTTNQSRKSTCEDTSRYQEGDLRGKDGARFALAETTIENAGRYPSDCPRSLHDANQCQARQTYCGDYRVRFCETYSGEFEHHIGLFSIPPNKPKAEDRRARFVQRSASADNDEYFDWEHRRSAQKFQAFHNNRNASFRQEGCFDPTCDTYDEQGSFQVERKIPTPDGSARAHGGYSTAYTMGDVGSDRACKSSVFGHVVDDISQAGRCSTFDHGQRRINQSGSTLEDEGFVSRGKVDTDSRAVHSTHSLHHSMGVMDNGGNGSFLRAARNSIKGDGDDISRDAPSESKAGSTLRETRLVANAVRSRRLGGNNFTVQRPQIHCDAASIFKLGLGERESRGRRLPSSPMPDERNNDNVNIRKLRVRFSRVERIYKKRGMGMPDCRHIVADEHLVVRKTNRNPWVKDDPEQKSWPIHAPPISTIVLKRVEEKARQTSLQPSFELARRILEDEICHAVCPEAARLAPRSSISHEHAEQMVRNGITRHIDEADVKNWGLVRLEAEAAKIRSRVIGDMLWENLFLPEAPKTTFSAMEAVMNAVGKACFAQTFDFRCWYYQLPLTVQVQQYMCFRVGNTWYAFTRSVMGHKHNVFVAQTITSILALLPEHLRQVVHSDIIIDNVLFYGSQKSLVEEAGRWFVAQCKDVGAQLGPYEEEASQIVTHRGVTFDLADHSFKLKAAWVTKMSERVKFCVANKGVTVDHWMSLAGMFAYARVVLKYTTPDYAFWRFMAKQMSRQGNTRLEVSVSVSATVCRMEKEIAENEPRRATDTSMPVDFLIITDASQAKPYAAWGAVMITPVGQILVLNGVFKIPVAIAAHINELEMRAAVFALDGWSDRLAGKRVHIMLDNAVAVAVLNLGRSASFNLNATALRFAAISRRMLIAAQCSWIPTIANPADGLSRGRSFTSRDETLLREHARNIGMVYGGCDAIGGQSPFESKGVDTVDPYCS